jgi:hypothetical protein
MTTQSRRGFLGRMLTLAAAPALAGYQINKLNVATVPSWFRHISVLEYGADRFGQRDSTAAFRAAIDVAYRTGKPLFCPPGNYLVAG